MNVNPEQFKNTKVLIIDDDKFLLDMYSLKFRKYGFNVDNAVNGSDALSKLEDGSYLPDIILTDVIMPHMDGVTFLQNLRDRKIAQDALVIILSNQGQPTDLEAAEKFGIDDYIIKALTIPTEVVEKVIEVYHRKRPEKFPAVPATA